MALYTHTHTHTPSLLENEKKRNLKTQNDENSKQDNNKNSKRNKKERKITSKFLFSKALIIILMITLVATGVLIINNKNNDKLGISKFLASVGANKSLANAGENTNNTNGTNTANTTPAINGEPSEEQKNTPVNNPITNALTDTENVKIYTDKNGDKVPIPKGYVGSKVTGENIVSTGYVIYEGTDEVTGNKGDSNVLDAQKTRNQWVWVPVLNPSGLTESAELLTYNNFDKDSMFKNYKIDEKTSHDFYNSLQGTYRESQESVTKYGGFYIGRYETGNLSQDKLVVQKLNTDIGSQSWYNTYNKFKALAANDTVKTSMIRNDFQSRMLQWLIDSGNKTSDQVNKDSAGWGNYSNQTFEYMDANGNTQTKSMNSDTRIPTGGFEGANANNVYDLAGNVRDWTLGRYGDGIRRTRGGSYGVSSSNSPAGIGNGNDSIPYYFYIGIGFRAALYLG